VYSMGFKTIWKTRYLLGASKLCHIERKTALGVIINRNFKPRKQLNIALKRQVFIRNDNK